MELNDGAEEKKGAGFDLEDDDDKIEDNYLQHSAIEDDYGVKSGGITLKSSQFPSAFKEPDSLPKNQNT